jgi:hypothetical protein
VNLLGLSKSNRLGHIPAEAGELVATVYEPAETFSKGALDTWSKQFPYRYGFHSDDPNIFYNSMHRIGITTAPTTRALFITDVALQQILPNLLMAQGRISWGKRSGG